MSENGQNIRPGFMDAMLMGIKPQELNPPEQAEAARLFLHAVIRHEVGNKEISDVAAPKDYIKQLSPETQEKVRVLLAESEWDHGLNEGTRIVKLGGEILGFLESKEEVEA